MNWEAVTAVATAATALIILVTVVVGRRQLDQLRRSTQLEGAMGIFAEMDSPVMDDAMRFVMNELPEKLEDEGFRKECEAFVVGDMGVHKELILLRFFERVGAYVEEGLIDGEIINKSGVRRLTSAWLLLADVVAIHRRTWGDFAWRRSERLYTSALRYLRAQGADPDKIKDSVLRGARRQRAKASPLEERAKA